MRRTTDFEVLDMIVVIMALLIVGIVVVALLFVTVPENQLAVVSSIVSALVGSILGAYAGFRWATSKQASETIADLARKTQAPSPEPDPSGEPAAAERQAAFKDRWTRE